MRRDEKGVGGFYEAIMAMMIVTSGVILLTASFTFLATDRGHDDQGMEGKCEEVMATLLSDPLIVRSDRLLDGHSLSHFDIGLKMANWSGGVKIMLTFPSGDTKVLSEDGGGVSMQRACKSEPVNIYYGQADIRPALLTVWVWP